MSNYDTIQSSNALIKMWTQGVPVESMAIDQLRNVASLPFIHEHVAVMPDMHFGMGATVGSVIATDGAIIPAAVGVDIGCGMNAVRLSLKAEDLPDGLFNVRNSIERMVPVGFEFHSRAKLGHKDHRGTTKMLNNQNAALRPGWESLVAKHPKLQHMAKDIDKKIYEQIGTLGGGNHFIELCLDENSDVWVMLHSGSRGTGNAIGRYFIEIAKEEMLAQGVKLPDKDLSYLKEGSPTYDDYCEGVFWAQDYARRNRIAMMDLVLIALRRHLPTFTLTKEAINCHHNYISKETHFGKEVNITRKGAVSAHRDELGIIPGSMGAKSFIVKGLGNADSFCSCSHGAGRVMSRSKAKKLITVEDHVAATKGVECRKDKDMLDESPAAYKDIEAVMAAQRDLVEIQHTLKQVLCVKG